MDAELKAIFTQQQFQTYDAKKTEMKEERKTKKTAIRAKEIKRTPTPPRTIKAESMYADQ
jgi:hypothetical protein